MRRTLIEPQQLPRLRQHVLHRDPIRLEIGDLPARPADETVDGVVVLRLVQRKLLRASADGSISTQ